MSKEEKKLRQQNKEKIKQEKAAAKAESKQEKAAAKAEKSTLNISKANPFFVFPA